MIKIEIGEKYGKLTILKEVEGVLNKKTGYRARRVLCQCDCGNKIEVALGGLRNKGTKSCGCINRIKN